MLASAPEPDDIIWKNLPYRPLAVCDVARALARQLAALVLLLLFSTPTAVLVYIKLDSTSGVYNRLYAEHSTLVTLVATYLPSLLLVRPSPLTTYIMICVLLSVLDCGSYIDRGQLALAHVSPPAGADRADMIERRIGNARFLGLMVVTVLGAALTHLVVY